MRPDDLGRRPEPSRRLGRAPSAGLLRVLMHPDFDLADWIGSYWGNPKTRTFGELLIDLEEDKAARPVVFGLLREIGGK
jgi:hypothetical protein